MTTTAALPRVDRRRNDELILRTAARVLAANPAAGMAAIADAAGLARPTVYRRYQDRDALVRALRGAVDAELETALGDLSAAAGPTTFVDLVRALAAVAARYPVALLRYGPTPGGPPAADLRVTQLLREAQAAGQLRTDVDAPVLNAALFGVLAAVVAERPDAGPHGVADIVAQLLLPGLSSTASSTTTSRSHP